MFCGDTGWIKQKLLVKLKNVTVFGYDGDSYHSDMMRGVYSVVVQYLGRTGMEYGV